MKHWFGIGMCVCLFVLLCAVPSYGKVRTASVRTIEYMPAGSDMIKAMTFNIRVDTLIDGPNRWSRRKAIVVNMLKSHKADVMGLQESLDEQTDYIQQQLKEYAHYAAGRNDGKEKGEACPIFYRKDRFELVDSGTFWFSNKPSKPGSKNWGALCPRICSWVRLMDKQKHSSFYVYNVHMDNLSQNSRKKSARLLAEKISQRKGRDPFIVTGDFNMELDNSAMQYLQKIGHDTPYPKMVDAWDAVNASKPDIGTRHGFRGRTSGPKIDHIPVSEDIQPISVMIDNRHAVSGRYPSDHFPVIATVRLNPAYASGADQLQQSKVAKPGV